MIHTITISIALGPYPYLIPIYNSLHFNTSPKFSRRPIFIDEFPWRPSNEVIRQDGDLKRFFEMNFIYFLLP